VGACRLGDSGGPRPWPPGRAQRGRRPPRRGPYFDASVRLQGQPHGAGPGGGQQGLQHDPQTGSMQHPPAKPRAPTRVAIKRKVFTARMSLPPAIPYDRRRSRLEPHRSFARDALRNKRTRRSASRPAACEVAPPTNRGSSDGAMPSVMQLRRLLAAARAAARATRGGGSRGGHRSRSGSTARRARSRARRGARAARVAARVTRVAARVARRGAAVAAAPSEQRGAEHQHDCQGDQTHGVAPVDPLPGVRGKGVRP
jgi:hypothetical protein